MESVLKQISLDVHKDGGSLRVTAKKKEGLIEQLYTEALLPYSIADKILSSN
jgi:hypothetical protein